MAKGIAETVRDLLLDTVEELGYELWDVEYVKEGSRWYLRITIDHENGISIDDCEKVHRTIDPILDEADPIADSYYLEVSSPGLERVLRLPAHFAACTGAKIQCKLFQPVDGVRAPVGILTDYDEQTDSVILQIDAQSLTIPRANISRANVVFDFEN